MNIFFPHNLVPKKKALKWIDTRFLRVRINLALPSSSHSYLPSPFQPQYWLCDNGFLSQFRKRDKKRAKGRKRERGWTGHLFKPLLRCHVDRAGGQIGTLISIGFFSRHGTRPLHGDEFELHPPIDRKARWLLGQASNCSTVQDRGKSSNSTSII